MKKIFVISVLAGLGITSLQAQVTGTWNLNGNTVPTQQAFLGTLNMAPLRFKTDKLQRMIILPYNGFVGMGVNDPKNPLHVHANDKRPSYDRYRYGGEPIEEPMLNDDERDPTVCERGTNSPASTHTAGTARGEDDDEEELISYSAIQVTNCLTGIEPYNGLLLSMENHKGYLRQLENDNFYIAMKDRKAITVTPSGNVGIGVDPQAKFHVEGRTFLNGYVGIGTNFPYQKLHVVDGNILISKTAAPRAPGSTNGSLLFGADIGNAPGQDYYGKWGIEYIDDQIDGYGLNFWKTWSNTGGFNHALFLDDNGNVGIGRGFPQRKLDVNGEIGAKGLFVNHTANGNWSYASHINVDNGLTKAFAVANTSTPDVFVIWGNGVVNAKKIYAEEFDITPNAIGISWFDHVFNQDYKLRSLSELEQFIKTNKHLPEIPSEKEVQENGINLGEMQGKLLLKIEELTLYIIEQEKQMKEMQKRLSELEEKKGGE